MANRSQKTKSAKSDPGSALHALHRASQVAGDLFASEMKNIDVTPRQLAVLEAVSSEQGLSQTDLVERTGVDRSTIADIVRRMTSKGLLKRKRTKEDARAYAVSLTEKSRKILAKARPAAGRADEKLLASLNAAERARFLQALNKIADAANDG